LSAGNKHDAPQGRELLETIGKLERVPKLLADKAYSNFKTRLAAYNLNFNLDCPPKVNEKYQREYNKELYKQRNVIERLFRRVKEFRRIFTCYDKLDKRFIAFIHLAFIFINLF